MEICWSCRMIQVAGYVRRSWSNLSEQLPKSTNSKDRNGNSRFREDGLQDKQGQDSKAQKLLQEHRVVLPGPTVISHLTISYPKITDAPSLVRRKVGSNHWDIVHERIQGQKRDALQCPASYQSCAASLNGGCCPNDRICGSASCLVNTSTTSAGIFACGRANYIACGIAEGGGCCPSNYICAVGGCSPSPGLSVTQTCAPGLYLCPSSLNYGCCHSSLGCALSSCYTTVPKPFTLTRTSKTTDSNSVVQTFVTTITSETIEGAPITTVSPVGGIIPKESALPITNTAIAKTPATTSAPNSATTSSGLSKAELGGIIGGASAFLLIIVIIAFCILRKLNKAIKVSEAANSRATSSERRSRRSRRTASMQQEIDAMSVDPLMMTPSEASRSIRRPVKKSTLHTTTHELASPSSPPTFFHPFRTGSPDSQSPLRYGPVTGSESQYSGSSHERRNLSADVTPPLRQSSNTSYFDYSSPSNPRYSQVSSIPGRRPSQHHRNWSDASDVSQFSDPAELDSDDRRSSIQKNINKLRRSFSRKKSDPPTVLTGGPTRADWGGLGHIAEAGESRIAVDGGPVITNADLREISLMDQPVHYEKTGLIKEVELRGGAGRRPPWGLS